MTERDFQDRNQARWESYEQLLGELEKGRAHPEAGSLPRRFRELCADLSLAEFRMYGERLTARLNALVIRGHELIHRERGMGWQRMAWFLGAGFPRAVRREWRLFWLCSVVFWLPFFAVMLSARHDIQWAQSILGPEGMAAMDAMYGGRESQVEHLRETYGANFMMFGFYINNNVGIDLRVFAGGLLAGVGTLFFLLFNGVFLGAAAGYVNEACDPEAFWTFVAGHSSVELVGLVIAGMAGMRLGLALLRPGRLPRARALREAAVRALPLIIGAGLLTVLAAGVEAFWSARLLPSGVKYAAGVAGWVLLTIYLLWAGKGARDAA